MERILHNRILVLTQLKERMQIFKSYNNAVINIITYEDCLLGSLDCVSKTNKTANSHTRFHDPTECLMIGMIHNKSIITKSIGFLENNSRNIPQWWHLGRKAWEEYQVNQDQVGIINEKVAGLNPFTELHFVLRCLNLVFKILL